MVLVARSFVRALAPLALAATAAAQCPPASTYDGFHQEGVGPVLAGQGDEVVFGHATGYNVGVFTRRANEYWSRIQLIGGSTSDPAANGSAVAWKGDLVVLGDWANGSFGLYQHGSISLVRRQPAGNFTPETDLFDPTPRANARFGTSVAVSEDTLRVAAGATGVGEVHVFVNGPGGWVHEQTLAESGLDASTSYGRTVELHDGRLFVGATSFAFTGGRPDQVFVYERVGGAWTLERRLQPDLLVDGSLFGTRIEGEGDRLLISAPAYDVPSGPERGAIFEYDLAKPDWWASPNVILPPAGSGTVAFGRDLDLGGERLAVSGSNVAYEYRLVGSAWRPLAEVGPPSYGYSSQFGGAVALYEDGILVGDAGYDGNGFDYPDGTGGVHSYDFTDVGGVFVGCGHRIAVEFGNEIELRVDWPAQAGRPFRVFGSVTGTGPNPVGGVPVPLTPDAYTALLQSYPGGAPFFPGSVGTLDAAGRASMTFDLPPGLAPALAGLELHHAVLAFGGATVAASNAVTFELGLYY